MPTFGTTSSAGTSGGSGQLDLIVGTKYTLSEAGTVTKISVYSTISGNCKGAIYADSGGVPGARLAQKSSATAVTGGAWNDLTLDSPVSLSAGTYWIAFVDDRNGMRNYKAGSTNQTAYASTSYASGCPSTFPSPSYQNNDHIAYATYSVASSISEVMLERTPTRGVMRGAMRP